MKENPLLFLVIFLLIVVAGVSIFIIANYNSLVKAEKAVEEAKAQIATVCQRRLDLIPNLIETVKAYAKHERQTLEAVTLARRKAEEVVAGLNAKEQSASVDMAKLAASQAALSSALRNIFALAENYPSLRASANFMALQDQFEGTENRIAVARQRYNYAVREYNTRIETFPGVFIAPLFGYTEKEFYEAKEEAYEPVRAEF